MATVPLQHFATPMLDAWRRPLSLAEAAFVALVLFVFGTAYCQLYCAIAFPTMNGMTMPLTLSMWRSAIETIPAVIGFELAKRVLYRRSDAFALVGVAGALLVSALVSILLVYVCHGFFWKTEMPLRPIIADRLPGLTLTTIAIFWATRDVQRANAEAAADLAYANDSLPPAEWIDWAQAAGNYVELHVRGRVILRRMPLHRLAGSLAADQFVRIHRSMLVNRARIAAMDRDERPNYVRLSDGTVLKIGAAYRRNVA